MSLRNLVPIVLLAVGIASPVFAQDAHVGLWKQNLAKSTSVPPAATPAPRSNTWQYEVFESNGLKMTTESVSADGTRTMGNAYSAHIDGKDYPYPNGTIALKRIDASSWAFTIKRDGKVVSSGTNVVSKDGKTITYTRKGVTVTGQPTSGVAIYEKQ